MLQVGYKPVNELLENSMPTSSSLRLISAQWPAPAQVKAYVTTNQANMALHVGDDPRKVLLNRAQLTEQLQLTQPICWLEQQHTTLVVKADHWQQPPIADAVWTDQPGLACAVMTADCLPVFFTDLKGEKVAAAHAGWRGLLGGVLENTVAAMHTDPAQLIAWFGPAISQAAFEVGEEVRAAFVEQDAEAVAAFIPTEKPNHWLADLYQLARLRLMRLGLTACYGGDYCTYNQSDLFYSYRRSARSVNIGGRMASLIWFDPPSQKS